MTAVADCRKRPSQPEFILLMALVIAQVALAIDAMLPALPLIAADLAVGDINDSQQVILVFFAGMALGQMFFGPLSDSLGRRPAIIAGFFVFVAGCALAIVATGFEQMLLGRLLQGVGAAGPRIVSVALVRDQFSGHDMARIMSFIMTIFILVPVFAPALGQLVLAFADWRAIFVLLLVLALLLVSWFWVRQPETLARKNRIRFSVAGLLLDIRAICRIRAAVGYTLTMGFAFGAFVAYLSNSQQILQLQYGLHKLFPLYFGILACAIGLASLVNARLVMRFGMRRLSRHALRAISLLSALFWLYAWLHQGHPPLAALMAYLLPLFFCFGILFGNLNALAMEPLGRIAGLGSALVGSVSTLLSVLFGAIVAGAYDQTVLPLVAGFALLGLASLLTVYWTDAGSAPEH